MHNSGASRRENVELCRQTVRLFENWIRSNSLGTNAPHSQLSSPAKSGRSSIPRR